jgi:putative ATPase
LTPLTIDHIRQILQRASALVCEENGVEDIVSQELLEYLADLCDGDGILIASILTVARNALNMYEMTFSLALKANQKNESLTVETLRPLLLRTQVVYDRIGDKHYDTISAFIKSMRGSGKTI